MSRRDGVKEKKCGCLYFEHGPPVLCETHKEKADRKEERAKRREVKGLRKIVADQARDLGHDLSQFREYPSLKGKWTAYCHSCGAFTIVYDFVPERGDQIAGKAVFERCSGGSATFAALRDPVGDSEGTDGDDQPVDPHQ